MPFKDAIISFRSTRTARYSPYRIHSEDAVKMTVSGPSRYTYLQLNATHTQKVNALAKKVGIEHERGPEGNKFMVYSGIFLPGRVHREDSSRKATSDEKKIFGQIFDIAKKSIATQMGWSVNPDDVTKIVLEKVVDKNFIVAQRACRLSIELSQSAAERLEMDKHSKFREYNKFREYGGSGSCEIYPGQH